MNNNVENRWYVKYTYILGALILTVYAMIMAKSIILPLLFALFFTILLSPFCRWLESYKFPRFLSSFAAILVGLFGIFVIGFLFYNQMAAFVEDADMFAERLEEVLASMEGFLGTWFAIEGEINLDRVVSASFDWIQENMASLTRGITGAASTITSFFLVPIYIYLMLLFRDVLRNFALRAFGGGDHGSTMKVQSIILKVKTLVQKYISGLLMVIAILAILNSLMLTIIGVDHAIFFGVFAAMLNVVPFIGPIMGSILPILYALITMDSLIYPLIILLGFYVIQLFESNLFTPTIVGSQVSMNALATLLLIFIGAQIWGLAGMILFIPLGAILKVICDEVESLNHFGYLLGRPADDKSGEKSLFAKKVSQFSDKTRKKRKNRDNDENSDEKIEKDSM